MKAKLFITACLAFLFCIILSNTALAEEPCKVTFKLPNGHYYYVNDGMFTVSKQDYVTVEFEKGHILTEEDVKPYTYHCCHVGGNYVDPHKSCRVTFKGWDAEPVGTEVTGDMTFNAILNEDVRNITVKMSKGTYTCISDTLRIKTQDGTDAAERTYSEFTMPVDRGYIITEDDVKIFSKVDSLDEFYQYFIYGFDKDPLGVKVDEDVAFTALAKKYCHLRFFLPDDTEWANDDGYSYVIDADIIKAEGESVDISELPDVMTMVNKNKVAHAYWDIGAEQLQNLQDDIDIKAVFMYRGDANADGVINTADAVRVLKYSAGMCELNETERLACDANIDNKVDTADATEILKHVAGMSAILYLR